MTAPCTHTRRGLVSSGPLGEDSYAAAPVCERPECIDEAIAFVTRMAGKPAFHVLDEVAS